MIIKQEGAVLTVSRPDEEHEHKSLHGLTRTLLHNMIVASRRVTRRSLRSMVSATVHRSRASSSS